MYVKVTKEMTDALNEAVEKSEKSRYQICCDFNISMSSFYALLKNERASMTLRNWENVSLFLKTYLGKSFEVEYLPSVPNKGFSTIKKKRKAQIDKFAFFDRENTYKGVKHFTRKDGDLANFKPLLTVTNGGEEAKTDLWGKLEKLNDTSDIPFMYDGVRYDPQKTEETKRARKKSIEKIKAEKDKADKADKADKEEEKKPNLWHTLNLAVAFTLDVKQTGDLITAHREHRNLKISEAAFKAGIHPETLRKIERGVSKISLDTLCRLAAVFGCKADDLLSYRLE